MEQPRHGIPRFYRLPSDIMFKDRVAFSLAEVSALTGFAVSTLYKWMRTGRLRTRKVGGRRIITSDALAELLVGDDPALRKQLLPDQEIQIGR